MSVANDRSTRQKPTDYDTKIAESAQATASGLKAPGTGKARIFETAGRLNRKDGGFLRCLLALTFVAWDAASSARRTGERKQAVAIPLPYAHLKRHR